MYDYRDFVKTKRRQNATIMFYKTTFKCATF